MNKIGKKRPLKECLGDNSNELRHKRRRFDNVVLLREGGGDQQNNSAQHDRRYYGDDEARQLPPRRILRAGGKRKKPIGLDESSAQQTSTSTSKLVEKEANENDIINELTKEFKKARLRPVFFTISSFIEQTVDEVGFTMADEPGTEVTIHLSLGVPRKEESDFSETANIMVLPDIQVDPESVNAENEPITDNIMIDRYIENNNNLKLHDDSQERMTNSMEIKFSSASVNSDLVENQEEFIKY